MATWLRPLQRSLVRFSTLALVLAAGPSSTGGISSARTKTTRFDPPQPQRAFVENAGQWAHPARFVAQLADATVFVDRHGIWLTKDHGKAGRGAAVRLAPTTGRPATQVTGEQPLPGRHTYVCGIDPGSWCEATRCAAVRIRGWWPLVDVVAYERDGGFEYDLVVAPGADLAAVELAVGGADSMTVSADGGLHLDTAAGMLRQSPPRTFLRRAGRDEPTAARVEIRSPTTFGFAVPDWRGDCTLVVDPGLAWSTLAGGASFDQAHAVAVDGAGIVTIAGMTVSPNYPVTAGAYDTSIGGAGSDAFVSRFAPSSSGSQQLLWSTFLGGSSADDARAMVVDGNGLITIAGFTFSTDFPTTSSAYDTTHNGSSDVFLAQIDPSLPGPQQLRYATYIGGAAADRAFALARDPGGRMVFAGVSASTNWPVSANAFDPSHNGGNDLVAAVVDPASAGSQQLVWSTFVGGSANDEANDVAVDTSGRVHVIGVSESANFPTTGTAFDTTANGSRDVVVLRLAPTSPSAQQLEWSTFLGTGFDDFGEGIGVMPDGTVMVTGHTWGPLWPTTAGAFDTLHSGGSDVVVTRLDPSGLGAQQLVFSTFLGHTDYDQATALHVDETGTVTVVGSTLTGTFPTTPGAADRLWNGDWDGFVARLDPTLPTAQQLRYSTFVGGAGEDRLYALAVDAAGGVAIAGATSSTNFPTTTGTFAANLAGNTDVCAATLDLLPTGVERRGVPSPGCAGAPRIDVTSQPRVGNATFAVRGSRTAPGSLGILALGTGLLPAPLPLLGVQVHIDPMSPFVTVAVLGDALGVALVPIPIPPSTGLQGYFLAAQFLWLDACAPGGFAASAALAITVQP